MTDHRVSVVIPCHNYGRFLPEAFASVLAQTRPPNEIVIVDDGSTDETAEAIRGIVAIHPCVRTLSRFPAEGLVRTMNDAVAMTTGDLVVKLDADDRFSSTYVEVLEAAFEDPSVGFAYTPEKLFGARTGWNRRPWSAREEKRQNLVNASGMFRRSVFDAVGGFSRQFEHLAMEDWDFWIKCMEQGADGRLVDGGHLEYRQHQVGNMNATRFRTSLRAHLIVWWLHRPFVRLSDVAVWLGRVIGYRLHLRPSTDPLGSAG